MRYYSPYSSRTRPPIWPRLLAVMLILAVLGGGGWGAWAFKNHRAGGGLQNLKASVSAASTAAPASVTPAALASAAQPTGAGAVGTAAPPYTGSGAPTPNVTVVSGSVVVPPNAQGTAKDAADTYVRAWNANDFATMYRLLTARAQSAIAGDAFQDRYKAIYAEGGINAAQVELLGQEPGTSQFRYKVTFASTLVGPFTQENVIPVTLEGGAWRIEWTPSLIFRELDGNGRVRFLPDDPVRGRILDRKGRPLALEGLIKQVGIVPGAIQNEQDMLTKLQAIAKVDPAAAKKRYQGQDPTYFIPVKNLPNTTPETTLDQLRAIPGVQVQGKAARTYPYGTLAAHVIGYMGEVTADQLKMLGPKGYRSGDMIGQIGVEAWAEEALAGKRGGKLAVVDPDTQKIRSTIAQKAKVDSLDVALTVDIDIQKAAEDSLGDKTGSTVEMDPKTGNILAMASHPAFDPNIFVIGPSDAEFKYVTDEKLRPQLNRATQATYPSGSIFKVVTMTAGFERGGFTATEQLPCGGSFMLGNNTYRDWNPTPHTVTYQEGLVQSCDVVFYNVGKKLDDMDANILPTYARQFGLGAPTGIQGVAENPGVVPDPQYKRMILNDGWSTGDAINLSIGQGFLLVTPLQMANIYSSIANGGTIWQPRLVSRILNVDGSVNKDYPPIEKGKLPTTPEHLAVIQAALAQVTTTASGTATSVFKGMNPPPAGKTGTAEQATDPHSWFAAYYPAQNPEIAGVVMVEAGGEGSANAAPITRAILEKYATIPK